MISKASARIVAVAALAGTLVATSPAPPAMSITARERKLMRMVNHARRAHHVRRLGHSRWISRMAERHSRAMARKNRLFHSRCLPCKFRRRGYVALGENAAVAGSVRGAHRKLMRSSSHRHNILSRHYVRAGMGVVRARGWFWITQIFHA
jgi:uncharacterized protein YkwD